MAWCGFSRCAESWAPKIQTMPLRRGTELYRNGGGLLPRMRQTHPKSEGLTCPEQAWAGSKGRHEMARTGQTVASWRAHKGESAAARDRQGKSGEPASRQSRRAPLHHGDSRHGALREPPLEWVAGDTRAKAEVAPAKGKTFPFESLGNAAFQGSASCMVAMEMIAFSRPALDKM